MFIRSPDTVSRTENRYWYIQETAMPKCASIALSAALVVTISGCAHSCTDEADTGWELHDDLTFESDAGTDVGTPDPIVRDDEEFEQQEPEREVRPSVPCDNAPGASVNYERNATTGDWTLAVPSSLDRFGELDIEGADASNRQAAAVFEQGDHEMAGFVVSARPPSGQIGPSAVLNSHRDALSQIGVVVQDFTGGQFRTHDGWQAAIGRKTKGGRRHLKHGRPGLSGFRR